MTTDADEVAEWIRTTATATTDRSFGMRLILVTHKSARVAGRGLAAADTPADLLIVDEAHRTAGSTDKHAAVVHHDDVFPALRRLYLTATPRVLTRRPGRAPDGFGMDDPTTYGPVLERYPFAQAIADRLLDDFRVVAAAVTSVEMRKLLAAQAGIVTAQGRQVPLQTMLMQAAVVKAVAEYGLRRILVFTRTIEQSRLFVQTLPAVVAAMDARHRPPGALTALHVDGDTSTTQRNAILHCLRRPPHDGWTVVSNARCLTEGVNIPAIDTVVFTERKESQIDIVQAVGRALRRTPGGSGVATVLVPIVLPDQSDAGSGAESGALSDAVEEHASWDILYQVIRALRAHDTTFATDLDNRRVDAELSRNSADVGSSGDAELPDRVLLRLPDRYSTSDILRNVSLRIIQETTDDWLEKFAALRAFLHTTGHTRVPAGHRVGDFDLGSWLQSQRNQYHKGFLAPEREEALNSVNVIWSPHDAMWERGIAEARAFHRQHGHLRPSRGYLNNWLSNARTAYRRGSLPADRVASLEALAIEWDPEGAAWRANLAAVKAFHERHGHVRIPADAGPADQVIRTWIQNQRTLYRAGKLTSEQIEAVAALGVEWSPKESAWQRNLDAATAFYQREGHLRVPRDYRDGSANLSPWLCKLRRDRRAGKLPPDQIEALDRIGMNWRSPTSPDRTPRPPPARRLPHRDLTIPTPATSNTAV